MTRRAERFARAANGQPMTPEEADEHQRHAWRIVLAVSLCNYGIVGFTLWFCAHIGSRINTITMIVIGLSYTMILPALVAALFLPHRKPVFDDRRSLVVLPGSGAQLYAILVGAVLLCVIGTTTILISFTLRRPMLLFPIGLIPFTLAVILTHDPLEKRFITPPARQWIRLAPYGASFKCLNKKTPIGFTWSQEPRVVRVQGGDTYIDYIRIEDIHLEKSLSLAGKPLTFTQLDALLDHFNTHPHDRQLLAQPEGADLVQTLLDTTPRP